MSRVVIVGGGLAGLAAAVALLETTDGPEVLLLERRDVLGGRAASSPSEDGTLVDNCQHVLMRCCTNLWDFYGRLGVRSRFRFLRRLRFLDRQGRIATLAGARLPAPFHLGPSFLRFGALSLPERLAVGRGMVRMMRASPDETAALDTLPFDAWLRKAGQPPGAIDRFWRVVLVSALNEEPERSSTAAAFHLFRAGFLGHPRAYEVGIPTVPLGELYEAPVAARFRSGNGELRRRAGVREIVVEDREARGVVASDGSRIAADHVIAATPFDGLAKLLPEPILDEMPAFRAVRELTHSPIAAVHLWFDRPVTTLDHAVLLDRTLQWMFNKTVDYGLDASRDCYLGLVVSAAREWMPLPSAEILKIARREVEEAFPEARGAQLVRSSVVKEAKATFSIAPGSEALRPAQQSPIRGLWLAGDWTRTGWPATMEGAVRSGYRCAEGVLAALGRPRSVVVPDGVFLE